VLKQNRLTEEKPTLIANTTYGKPQYNVVKGEIQRIETHRGCPWNHEYCFEPTEMTDFPIPKIVKNQVQILDMAFLCRENVLETIKELGKVRINRRVVYYEAVCGFDFRFLTQEIANALKKSRFILPRMAWDGPFSEQKKLKKAVLKLVKAGYKRNEIMLFMIVNWRIPYDECLRKLDLMKVWNVKVCDCCYNGGYKLAVPEYWTLEEIKSIRSKSRKHNQLVTFGIDPQSSINPYTEAS